MSVVIKSKVEFALKPFSVPNFVLCDGELRPRDEGFVEGRRFALHELDTDTLEKLCREFKTEVFKKAGKQMHPVSG